jgi:hypothetical protein
MKPPEHLKLERFNTNCGGSLWALQLGSDDISPEDHAIRSSLKMQALAREAIAATCRPLSSHIVV